MYKEEVVFYENHKILPLLWKKYYVDKSQKDRSKFCSDACFRMNKNTQVPYRCDYCGKDFLTRQNKVYKRMSGQSKYLCCSAQCAKDIQKPKWEDINLLFEQNNYMLHSTEYVNAKRKLEYTCSIHLNMGIQSITYNNLKSGFGCRYCGRERTAMARRLSFDEVKNIFAKNDMILLEQEYKNTQEKLKYICKNHIEVGVQEMSTVNAYKNHCPYCNMIKGENKILSFLMQHKIRFQHQKSYDNLLGVGGGKLSYDFYLPDHNVLIEYQGEQHEHPISIFGGEKQFNIQKEHDRRKRDYAMRNNIDLFEIWYYDFVNIDDILTEKFL